MRRGALVLLLGAALTPGCVTAKGCADDLPAGLRADVIRYAVDKGLCGLPKLPQDQWALAMGAGTPYEEMTPERRREVARYAVGFADCINERVTIPGLSLPVR